MADDTAKPVEELVWEGGPSQWMNLPIYLLCILIIPIFYAVWRWIELSCTQYELTTERFRQKTGVFNRVTQELELYRIKDTELFEPLFQRIFGLGTITMHTSDKTTPIISITGIKSPEQVRQHIRDNVELVRKRRGVREFDVD
jgi:uncharacterized membrane protein YdbT with pleckstrin-like domain